MEKLGYSIDRVREQSAAQNGFSREIPRSPNHWVEKDAANRASHPVALGVMRTAAVAVIIVSLMAASIVALSAMIHGAGGKFEWNWFYPWVIGPYVVLLGVFGLPRSQTYARAFAGSVTALVVLVFTCWFYIGAMWFSVSSTSALIFVFAPVYLFVGGLVVWGIAWFLFARMYGANDT